MPEVLRALCASAAQLEVEVKISVVIPTLDEAALIQATLARLQPLRQRGHELIVADGGSADDTLELARPLADRCLITTRGRAHQMNAGAQHASGEVLLFLHADTQLPDGADRLVHMALAGGAEWGRFDVRIDGRHRLLAIIGWLMNRRSVMSGVCTGDQAIFVRRESFEHVGGYPPIELMEDIALSKSLRSRSWPARLRETVLTSGRRWEARGVWRTVLLMWWLRLRYFLGASPARLQRIYECEER